MNKHSCHVFAFCNLHALFSQTFYLHFHIVETVTVSLVQGEAANSSWPEIGRLRHTARRRVSLKSSHFTPPFC